MHNSKLLRDVDAVWFVLQVLELLPIKIYTTILM